MSKELVEVNLREVAEVIRFIHDIAEKGNKREIDMVSLSLTVSESLILIMKRGCYHDKPFHEIISEVRKTARCIALRTYRSAIGETLRWC